MMRINIFLGVLVFVSVTAVVGLWTDNRYLATIIKTQQGNECVRPESFSQMLGVCEQISRVSKQERVLLIEARRQLEEMDDIKDYNERGYGKVRRVTRHVNKRSHRGYGIGGR